MRLLIVTQVVDDQDLSLSFFTRWIEELSVQFESLEVICLKEGTHALPSNVRVHSLGKEDGERSRFAYALTFLSLAWGLRGRYDRVLVHMNQEYILIAGLLWKALGKPVYLWRNHYAGSFLTDIAALLSRKVFCTSKESYTARYGKTVFMPVGVDIERFQTATGIRREPRSILLFARMATSKRHDVFIDALGILLSKGVSFVGSIYGSPLPKDKAYYDNLVARAERVGLHDRLRFHPGVPHEKAPEVFRAHDIFVNAAQSGMYDKMLFEAGASGCLVAASSLDWKEEAGEDFSFLDGDSASLADRLKDLLALPPAEAEGYRKHMEEIAASHSLSRLAARLREELSS